MWNLWSNSLAIIVSILCATALHQSAAKEAVGSSSACKSSTDDDIGTCEKPPQTGSDTGSVEKPTDYYALRGLISELSELALRYSTELPDFKQLIELLQMIKERQPKTVEYLPKRTSYDKAIQDIEQFVQKHYKIDGLKAKYFPGMGIGLEASRDIKADEEICRIPVQYVLSDQQVQDDYKCLGVIENKDSKYPGLWRMTNTTLQLLKHALGDTFYRPYINSLPKDFTHPLYFTYGEMALLEGSLVFTGSINTVQEMAAMYAQLWTALRKKPDCAAALGVPFEKFTLEAFQWAYTITLTRNYDGSFIDGQRNKVLIPYWDLFNHRKDADLDTYNDYHGPKDEPKPKGKYITYALRNIKKGEQVFMHYLSPLDPSEAFSTWGFVEINEVYIPFHEEFLDEAGNRVAKAVEWVDDEGLYIQDPDQKSRIIKPDMFADILDMVAGQEDAEFLPGRVEKAWKLVVQQIDVQLQYYPQDLAHYENVYKKAETTANAKFVCKQQIAEIEFLRKIRAHIVKSIILQ